MAKELINYAALSLTISMTSSCGLNKDSPEVSQVRPCQDQCQDTAAGSASQTNQPKSPDDDLKDGVNKHEDKNVDGSGHAGLNNKISQ